MKKHVVELLGIVSSGATGLVAALLCDWNGLIIAVLASVSCSLVWYNAVFFRKD